MVAVVDIGVGYNVIIALSIDVFLRSQGLISSWQIIDFDLDIVRH